MSSTVSTRLTTATTRDPLARTALPASTGRRRANTLNDSGPLRIEQSVIAAHVLGPDPLAADQLHGNLDRRDETPQRLLEQQTRDVAALVVLCRQGEQLAQPGGEPQALGDAAGDGGALCGSGR